MVNKNSAMNCGPTHYNGCACVQYRHEQMESALKVIQIWAGTASEYPLIATLPFFLDEFVKIADKCREALGDPKV